MKINTKALALSFGIVWAVGIFLLTWWFIIFDGATGEVTLIGKLYRGYTVSPLGSVIGLLYGFFDGAVFGLLIGWVYNYFTGKFSGQSKKN